MPHRSEPALSEKTHRKIRIEDAVGSRLAHDITEIRPGQFKGPAFRRGHRIETGDLCHLMRLGKRHLYILDLGDNDVHEDDAALEMAEALAGSGVGFDPHPSEGKIQLRATLDGLFKARVRPLVDFNMNPAVMCASAHTNTPVKKGQTVAAARAIPLVVGREELDRALHAARSHAPIFSVKPFRPLRARLVITGSEVYDGLIEDRFEAIVRSKLDAYGAMLVETAILPDDRQMIAEMLRRFLHADTQLIITTGGMSVDPDDVTRSAIMAAGAEEIHYGAAVLPGAMFQIAYKGAIPIAGIPACGLYHATTVFDLILPRLLAGERPDNHALARMAHGGLCLHCADCRYPACSFGKSD